MAGFGSEGGQAPVAGAKTGRSTGCHKGGRRRCQAGCAGHAPYAAIPDFCRRAAALAGSGLTGRSPATKAIADVTAALAFRAGAGRFQAPTTPSEGLPARRGSAVSCPPTTELTGCRPPAATRGGRRTTAAPTARPPAIKPDVSPTKSPC